MISCVKSWDKTEYSARLFHDIPLSDKYLHSFGQQNRHIDNAKHTTFIRFDNLLNNRSFSVQRCQNDYMVEIFVKPHDHSLSVISPFNNDIMTIYIGELRLKTTISLGVPITIAEHESIHNIKSLISKRFRSFINREMFICLLNGVGVYTHNWNKKVYLERFCGS